MKHFTKLWTICGSVGFLIGVLANAQTVRPSLFSLQGVATSERPAVLQFLTSVENKLPSKIVNGLSHDIISGPDYGKKSYPLIVQFARMPNENAALKPPVCEPVNRMDKAQQRIKEWQEAEKRNRATPGLIAFRYDGETQVQIVSDPHSTAYGEKIILNANLLPAILHGPSTTPNYSCGHQTYYRLAQASVIYAVARIFDNIRVVAASRYNNGVTSENPNARAALSTLISETDRYQNLTFGWNGQPGDYKTVLAYWPRAVSAYAYASDVRANFAFNMEYYLLDSQYQCRKPLLYQYFSQLYGTDASHPFTPHYDDSPNCQVNTKIFLQFMTDNSNSQNQVRYYIGDGETDLNPQSVREVDYYRASVGNDSASMFGHAMYKISFCAPGSGPDSSNAPCDDNELFDLIINPRANPMQMKLDNAKGLFGGYPSQFFISRFEDIFTEYASQELRDLFSFPLGHVTDSRFVPLNGQQKTQFIWATLAAYWQYVGNYKFISNNCADETLRLYKVAFDNPAINEAHIYTPRGVSQLFAQKNVIDKKLANEVKEPAWYTNFPVIRLIGHFLWTKQDENLQKKEIENDPNHIDESLLYALENEIGDIYDREHKGQTATQADIDQSMKGWSDLATVSDKASEFCRNSEKYSSRQAQIAQMRMRVAGLDSQYETLYQAAKARLNAGDQSARKDMAAINHDFLAIVTYMLNKHESDFTKVAVQLAYDITEPNNGQKRLCSGNGGFTVTPQMKKNLQTALANYNRVQYLLMPFNSELGAKPGYGIPLESEMLRDTDAGREKLKQVIIEELQTANVIRDEISPNMGMDLYLLNDLKNENNKLIADNCNDHLIGFAALSCQAK